MSGKLGRAAYEVSPTLCELIGVRRDSHAVAAAAVGGPCDGIGPRELSMPTIRQLLEPAPDELKACVRVLAADRPASADDRRCRGERAGPRDGGPAAIPFAHGGRTHTVLVVASDPAASALVGHTASASPGPCAHAVDPAGRAAMGECEGAS